MRTYSFSFQTKVRFEHSVKEHYFKIRCLPYKCRFQEVLEEDFSVSPCQNIMQGRDTYGNDIQYGYAVSPHSDFSFASRGRVTIGQHLMPEEPKHIFSLPTPLTTATQEMIDFAHSAGGVQTAATILDKAQAIAEAVNKRIAYRPQSTNTKTSAAEAFAKGEGVCQDFSHITLALLRALDVPCRYVSGFMPGEGQTHAWVEVNDNGMWYAIDPTHNHLIETAYLKIAHGCDFADCPIDRGVFLGNPGRQDIEVRLSLTEE